MATITVSPITNVLPRDELAKFLPTPRAVRAFEGMQTDVTETIPDAMGQIVDLTNALLAAPYITWADTPTLENERTLTVTSALQVTNTGSQIILGLAETGFAAGFYGSATQTIGVRVDLYGRVSGVEVYDLNSDNVAEGVAHLYFNEQRARAVLSGGAGVDYDQATGEIALADTPVTPDTYGSATAVPVLAIDQQGRVTGASTAAIPVLDSGIYTPTLTNSTNISASQAYECQYMRVGDVVSVSGRVNVQATAAGVQTHLGISLPVPSAMTAATQCAGTAAAISVSGQVAGIQADHVNDLAALSMIPSATTMQTMFFTFTYRVL